MSKQGKRKITVELPKAKDLSNRPSVFERLGTKKAAAAKKASESCRQWAQHGTCPYGKTCKFASTHTLISPSKQRAANKDSTEIKRTLIKDDAKSRLHSTVVVRSGRTPEPEWDNWDQNDLEYADADVLEKRRQQLQRELEIQLKMDTGKDNRKEKKKTVPSSSSSSRSSSTTSVSSSTSGGSSSSTSSPRDSRKKVRKAKSKRNSSSSSGSEHVSKKKRSKTDSLKRDKSASCKRTSLKKDVARVTKKHDVTAAKKKVTAKTALSKKSLSPSKKAGGTPPINNKNIPKGYILNKHNTHSKSPTKKDKNRSASPHSTKEREKDKEREREKERDRLKEKEREREKDRDKDREREREKERTTRRSKSPRSKGRSRSPLRRHGSHPPRDPRRKDSPTRSRGSSPKGRTARDNNSDKHRSKTSPARDERKDDKRKDKDLKDRSMEHRKDKHDEKDRHDRLRNRDHQREDTRMNREKEREEALARCQERQRERERLKDQTKREQEAKRNRERDRRVTDKGLAKPTPDKPVERLLPRPEERLAALAATNNRNIGLERAISSNRERSEARTERSSRKGDRSVDRDRIDRLPKRQNDRRNSMDRVDRNDYNRNMDRSYDHSHSMDRSYDRPNERYDDLVTLDRERERSPGSFPVQGRERDLHYDSPYDIQGSHSRGYVDPDERVYDDHLDDHLAVDRGFIDDGRARDCGRRDDHSWEGRETSVDQERQYIHHSHAQHGHPHKDWENDDYHGDWNRQDRHWQHRDPQHQVMDWTDKEREVDSTWHSHRQPAGGSNASRNRPHDDGNYRGRMDHGRMDQNQHLHSMSNKRNIGSRDVPPDMSDSKKPLNMSSQSGGPPHSNSSQPPHPSGETEDPIPDDLSEISDDPDEILNRDDEISDVTEPAVTASAPPDPQNSDPYGMIGLQPFRPDYEPMVEHDVEKPAPKQASVETSSQKSEISAGCQENNSTVPIVEHKAEQNQEPDPEDTLDNLGFEEISDGELEEDQRVKGLGDALGVDWASLVAEVQGKKEKGLGENGDSKEQNGARQYWQPQRVLARIGVSLYMAGETMVKEIFSEKKIVIKTEDGINSEVNGKEEEFKLSHPVASIQVAIERRKRQRLSLFGTGTGFTRALCARQDLALRRHLCNLPINESVHEIHPPDPQLFAMAQKLIQKSS